MSTTTHDLHVNAHKSIVNNNQDTEQTHILIKYLMEKENVTH